VSDYLASQRAGTLVSEAIEAAGADEVPSDQSRTLRIRARTARRWLKKMGFDYKTIRKGVYFDGHERQDIREYRDNVFIPRWNELSMRFVRFNEDGTWEMPQLPDGVKPLVLVTHDESTFNANDGRRMAWIEKGKQPIKPKGQGKGIMVSGKF